MDPFTIKIIAGIFFAMLSALGYFVLQKFKELKDLKKSIDDHETRITVLERITGQALDQINDKLVKIDERGASDHDILTKVEADVQHLLKRDQTHEDQINSIKNKKDR